MMDELAALKQEYEKLAAQQSALAAIFHRDVELVNAKMAEAQAVSRRLQDIQHDPNTTQASRLVARSPDKASKMPAHKSPGALKGTCSKVRSCWPRSG